METDGEYEAYIAAENQKNKPDPNNLLAAFMPKVRPAELIPAPSELAQQAKESDVALITIGRTSGEFADRTLEGDFYLTDNEKKMIEVVSKAFRAEGKKTIVILNIGESSRPLRGKICPMPSWLPGSRGRKAVTQ